MIKKISVVLPQDDAISLVKILENAGFYTVEEDDEASEIIVTSHELFQFLQNRVNELSEEKAKFAHELKHPLADVKGYTDVLLSGMAGEVNEQQKKFLTVIKSNANRMQVMIDDLRDGAPIDIGDGMVLDRSPFHIQQMVDEAMQTAYHTLRNKQHAVSILIPDDLPLALGDATCFSQVLYNLISNAHKYTADNGLINIGATIANEHIQMSVSDNGIGIPDDELPLLFRTEYFRGKSEYVRKQSGIGLGLRFAYRLISNMNGEIWVESEVGEGSTFHFTIPIAKDEHTQD